MKIDTTDYQHKNEIITKAISTLKKEFVGLDDIIDGVMDNYRAWFLFPHLQQSPLVISLWGLTGVGKTSLINRILELTNMEENSMYFNFAAIEEMDNYTIEEEFSEKISMDTSNKVFIYDEFQYAATINEGGHEKEHKSGLKTFWELMDSGIFHRKFHLEKIERLKLILYFLKYMNDRIPLDIQNGVWVNRSVCSELIALTDRYRFDHVINFDRHEKIKPLAADEKEHLLHHDTYESIARSLTLLYPMNKIDMWKKCDEIKMYNYEQLYECISNLLNLMKKGYNMDFSHSIIFVLGNLDEAYEMTFNLDPDMSCDQFHEISKKITLVDVKEALQKRFRNEQIARLGNIHFIYPSFSSESFRRIIDLSLDKYASYVKDEHDIIIKYDDSIKDLIYRDAVFPTHGTRPVFSTIHEIVKTKLPYVFLTAIDNNIQFSYIQFAAEDNNTIIQYYNDNDECIRTEKMNTRLHVENLRKNTDNEEQAVVAVHESGHFLVYTLLTGKLPEKVCSHTASSDAAGFIMKEHDDAAMRMMSRKDINNEIAICLAGKIAEEVIFGQQHITSGASSDLQEATILASRYVRRYGMYNESVVSTYCLDGQGSQSSLLVYDVDNHRNKAVENLIHNAYNNVIELFNIESVKKALQASSYHLLHHPLMSTEKMQEIKDMMYDTTAKLPSVKSERYYRDIVESFGNKD